MSVYNGCAYVEDAIQSVVAQTYPTLELVVIDDGSTDDTPAILERWRAADHRIRVHGHANVGLPGSLNCGCSLAKGELLARIDADDVAPPDRLRAQVQAMVERPDIVLLGGAAVFMSHRHVPVFTLRYPLRHDLIVRALRVHNAFNHSAVIMRRHAFEYVGGYRTELTCCEDYDLWCRLSETASVANLPDPMVFCRLHPGQFTTGGLEQQWMELYAVGHAARMRRATGSDPLDGRVGVTWDLLAEFGIDPSEVRASVAAGSAIREAMMELAGYRRGGA